jgi:hypothetical protein
MDRLGDRQTALNHSSPDIDFVVESIDLNDLSGLDGLKSNDASRHVRKKIIDFRRFCADDQDGNFPTREVLLIADVLVNCDKNVEFPFGQHEQFAVLFSCEPYFWDSEALMPVACKARFQQSGDTLIQQKSHLSPAKTTAFASSSAAIAFSRVTVGNSSKN